VGALVFVKNRKTRSQR